MTKFIYKAFLLIAIFSGLFIEAFAHGGKMPLQQNLSTEKEMLNFVPNQGQWTDPFEAKVIIPGGEMFLTSNGFMYSFTHIEDMQRIHELYESGANVETEVIRAHAYKVSFEGAQTNVAFTGDDKRDYYHNYFLGNNPNNWKGGVSVYGGMTQKGIYNGVDLKVYSQKNQIKYDFIVAPHADPNQIRLKFDGVSPQLLASGDLKITTSVNEVIESKPLTYQIINGKQVEIPSKYQLKKGVLSFVFPEGYDVSKELIIDPTLVFATYSGSVSSGGNTASAYSYATTYDAGGSLYAGADSWTLGWPVTVGAFQTTFGGGAHDVGVNKYTPNGGALVYSTYYGGSGADYPSAMFVNQQNELIIIGHTTSVNLPMGTGTPYDNTYNGGTDIFIVHFTNDATGIIGATYLGTNASEPQTFTMTGLTTSLTGQNCSSPLEINVDANGNIWGVANTTSAQFPLTANAVQNTNSGGADGVVFKFDPTLSNLLYSTYLGGSSNEALFGLQFNLDGNVVVCGVTQSANFPTTTGVLHETSQGGLDGFVTILDQNTGAILASTYVGTSSTDQAVNLQIDKNNNIYVLGRTLGNYPISPNVYSITNGDIFIDQLSPDLTTSLLSTRLGTAQNGSIRYFPTAFLLDNCDNIYVAGLGASNTGTENLLPSGMPLSQDAFSTTTDHFWFGALKPYFEDLLFGSYYGSPQGDHTHVGVNRLDPSGNVYHSVCSASSNFPTTAGAYRTSKMNSGQDIISFKFSFDANGVNADGEYTVDGLAVDSVCVPATVNFTSNSTSPYGYTVTWDFGDGNTSNDPNPTHIFTEPGTYTIIIHAHSDSACITDDYDTLTLVAMKVEMPVFTITPDTVICGEIPSLDIGIDISNPSPNHVILWGPNNGIIGANNQANIQINPAASNFFWVEVHDTIPGFCGETRRDTFRVDFAPRGVNIITNDTIICQDATIPIQAEGTDGYDYVWSPADGVSNINALQPTITVTETRTYTLTASHDGCPDTSQTITIEIQRTPTINLGPDREVCEWDTVNLTPVITPYRNDYIYTWTPSSGLFNVMDGNAQFIADTSITYHLNVSTPIGCNNSDSVSFIVHPGNFGGIVGDTGYCPPNAAQLWADGGNKYVWTPSYGLSNTNIANPVANPATPTDYTVYITNKYGCKDTLGVSVDVFSLGVLNIPDEVTIYPGEQYHVTPETNGLYFNWFPPSGVSNTEIADPILSPTVRTRYFVTAVTERGCEVRDSIDILVGDLEIDMPNAFTPGNGINNIFKPAKRGIAELKEFAIFNRWGNKLFSTTNINEGWDGNYKDIPQPMGVYIYIIEAVGQNGQIYRKEGNVTLIR